MPLRLRDTVIGMIGVANKPVGYDPETSGCLTTFAGQVAVAVDNARLYERQRQMIAELQQLRDRLTEANGRSCSAANANASPEPSTTELDQEIFMIGVRLIAP